jgi:hypothetical protein
MGRLKRRFKASGVPCPSVPLWEGGRAPGPGLRPARGQAPLDGEGIFVISHALPLPRCLSALAVGLLVVHGSLSRPGCAGRGTMGSGKTGGRRLAHLTICATSRPPVRRFPFPPVPLLPAGIPAPSLQLLAPTALPEIQAGSVRLHPARRGHSAPRRTSRRDLPGRAATFAARRRRRSLPTQSPS